MYRENILTANLNLVDSLTRYNSLDMLPIGTHGKVKSFDAKGIERRRMLDLGIVKGTNIEAVMKSPSGDPVAYNIRGALIALRNEDAAKIQLY